MINESQFRIIPDPKARGKWAYEPLAHHKHLGVKGGFRTSQDARRAFEREVRKKT